MRETKNLSAFGSLFLVNVTAVNHVNALKDVSSTLKYANVIAHPAQNLWGPNVLECKWHANVKMGIQHNEVFIGFDKQTRFWLIKIIKTLI